MTKEGLSNISTAELFDEVLHRLNYDGDNIDAITVGEIKRAIGSGDEGPPRVNYRKALMDIRDIIRGVNSMMLSPNADAEQRAYVIGMNVCAITYVLAEIGIAIDLNDNRKR